jgi:bacteriocin biosynthesis cyclodehydratase domain-containing protein
MVSALSNPPLRWRCEFAPTFVDGEAGYLVSENEVLVLEGVVLGAIAPLVDGTRTAEEIVEHLLPRFAEPLIRAVLEALSARSLTTTVPAPTSHQASFFEAIGYHGTETLLRLSQGRVRMLGIGGPEVEELASALQVAGVPLLDSKSEPDEELLIAVVDDYLNPALAELNANQLERGIPWILVRMRGTTVWTGPVFVPWETACWQCLQNRLESNRSGHVYLGSRLGLPGPAEGPTFEHPLATSLVASRLVLLAARALDGMSDATSIQTDDFITGDSRRHRVDRRPQCPGCGDPAIQARSGTRPVAFESRAKVAFESGGARAVSTTAFLNEFGGLVSPLTGVATILHDVEMPDDLLHLVISGHNAARRPRNLETLQLGLRSESCGKGVTERQARASALGEAIERHCGVYQGDENQQSGSLASLDDEAIDPRSCLLFSERQYAYRQYWNMGAAQFNYVHEEFDSQAVMSWSPVWSVSSSQRKWLPTQYLYYGFDDGEEAPCAVADSNGCAAGTSYEDAALQGLCELVERDAVALWWYNRVARPGIDLASLADTYVDRMQNVYAELGREVWALDLTSDFGIPVVGAFSRALKGETEDILIAFGAHLDPRTAILRALTEMNQFLPGVLPGEGGEPPTFGGDASFASWCHSARLETHPYLAPSVAQKPRTVASWPSLATEDLGDDLACAVARIEGRGIEVFVLDQTRPDIGLPVVKMIAPGMRHFWPRFAPGRLYEVPVLLGWVEHPTLEEELNPVGVFI